MNVVTVEALIAGAGVVVSVCVSMFVSGTRWGRVEATLNDLNSDRVRQADVNSLKERLARIEGMFTLQLKPPDRNP